MELNIINISALEYASWYSSCSGRLSRLLRLNLGNIFIALCVFFQSWVDLFFSFNP